MRAAWARELGRGRQGCTVPEWATKFEGFLENLQNTLLLPGWRVAGLKVCSQVFLPWTSSHAPGRVQHSCGAEPAGQVLPGGTAAPHAWLCLGQWLWVTTEDFQTGSACTCIPAADGWLDCTAPPLLLIWGLYMWCLAR